MRVRGPTLTKALRAFESGDYLAVNVADYRAAIEELAKLEGCSGRV